MPIHRPSGAPSKLSTLAFDNFAHMSVSNFGRRLEVGEMSSERTCSREVWRTHNAIFTRTSLTLMRVPAKVPHIHWSAGKGAFSVLYDDSEHDQFVIDLR